MSSQLDALLNMLAGTARGWRATYLRVRADKAPKKTLKL